ncbi:MAG: tetratricopeptide repeat protein, partial [Propionibacteriaceae bacterium]|nr:tetratricopeptide repeat protein [Propionibacteriaceae bacterium]
QAGLLARVGQINPSQAIAAADQAGASIDQIMAASDVEVAAGQLAAGFGRMVAAIASHNGAERDRLRLRLLELFQTVDPADPQLLTARRQLATALF